MALTNSLSYLLQIASDRYMQDTVFERIVKVCLTERFLNSREQDTLATKVLLDETTDFRTKLMSLFDSELRQRNYKLAHRILYEKSISDALQIHSAEYAHDSGNRYRVDLNKLEPFLEKIGVKKA